MRRDEASGDETGSRLRREGWLGEQRRRPSRPGSDWGGAGRICGEREVEETVEFGEGRARWGWEKEGGRGARVDFFTWPVWGGVRCRCKVSPQSKLVPVLHVWGYYFRVVFDISNWLPHAV
jgi:hypothetical protein